jgi:hypothetical protein
MKSACDFLTDLAFSHAIISVRRNQGMRIAFSARCQ